jgi:hypothetical protein
MTLCRRPSTSATNCHRSLKLSYNTSLRRGHSEQYELPGMPEEKETETTQ